MASLYKRVPDKDCESSDPATPTQKRRLELSLESVPRWALVMCLCCVVANICSIDRTAMSVAVLPMAHQFGWPDSVKGAVNGAFNLGYMVTNLVAGYLAASYGPKRVLGYGVVLWSLFTLGTPAAASTAALWVLLVVRAIMGLGEGVAFPCLQVLLKMWVPADKRTRALGLVYSGHQIGNILSLLLSPPIILRLGWPWVFYLYGSLGFLWLAAWEPFVPAVPPSPPSTATSITVTASGASADGAGGGGSVWTGTAAADSHTTAPAAATAGFTVLRPDKAVVAVPDFAKVPSWRHLPWSQFFSSPAVWALVVAHCMFGVSYNIAMSWLPSYYNATFGVNLKQSAMLSVLPFAVMAVMTNASGWMADALINQKLLSTSKTRKLLQCVGTSIPAACLAYLTSQHGKGSLTEALLLLTLMLGGLGLQAGGFASTHQDICTRNAGVLYGFTNACASLAGSISVYGTGVVLDWTHSWGYVFAGVMVCNVLSCVVFLLFSTSEPLFD